MTRRTHLHLRLGAIALLGALALWPRSPRSATPAAFARSFRAAEVYAARAAVRPPLGELLAAAEMTQKPQ